MPNAWASHGARKTGPSASRGIAGSSPRSGGRIVMSGPIEVVIPQVDVHELARGRRRPPQLLRAELHAVDVLGLLALLQRVGVGKDEDAVVAVDDPAAAAR